MPLLGHHRVLQFNYLPANADGSNPHDEKQLFMEDKKVYLI